MSRPAERGQDLPGRMIQRVNLLVPPVHDVHELLFLIAGEVDPPCRAAGIRQSWGSGPDPDVLLKLPHLIEYLDAIALPVADVYQSGVADRDAMDNLREHGRITALGFLFCSLAAPLP